MSMPERIDAIYAWVATEADGSEGICAHAMMYKGAEMLMPLVGADRARVEALRPFARSIAERTGSPIRLVLFSKAATIESVP
jgi:hypothetical protein